MTVAAVAVISRNKTWKSSFSNEEFEKGMRAMLSLVTCQCCPDDTLHVHPINVVFIVVMPYWMKRLHDSDDFFD